MGVEDHASKLYFFVLIGLIWSIAESLRFDRSFSQNSRFTRINVEYLSSAQKEFIMEA